MSTCPPLAAASPMTLAGSLKDLDCRTGDAVAAVFSRLFGPNGHLITALTLILTIYVALYAVALLTGRARLGISALTPRMMSLGMVLTFATSWAAYQSTVWSLATGAPDEVARVVAGTNGSATIAFADRLDGLFAAIADSADTASKPAAPTETGITPPTPMVGGFTSSTVLWLSALMLLLGSVGVLVTAKIALAALLALGPIFIVLALFDPTRGLFEGWLKAVALFALAPLFAVLIGGGAIAALEPIASALVHSGDEPQSRLVGTMFVGAAVFVALMIIALKTTTTIVAGWRLPGARAAAAMGNATTAGARNPVRQPLSAGSMSTDARGAVRDDRIRGILAAVPSRPFDDRGGSVSAMTHRQPPGPDTAANRPIPVNANDPRTLDVSRRFRPAFELSAREKLS